MDNIIHYIFGGGLAIILNYIFINIKSKRDGETHVLDVEHKKLDLFEKLQKIKIDLENDFDEKVKKLKEENKEYEHLILLRDKYIRYLTDILDEEDLNKEYISLKEFENEGFNS